MASSHTPNVPPESLKPTPCTCPQHLLQANWPKNGPNHNAGLWGPCGLQGTAPGFRNLPNGQLPEAMRCTASPEIWPCDMRRVTRGLTPARPAAKLSGRAKEYLSIPCEPSIACGGQLFLQLPVSSFAPLFLLKCLFAHLVSPLV